jgi:hypothetical protein
MTSGAMPAFAATFSICSHAHAESVPADRRHQTDGRRFNPRRQDTSASNRSLQDRDDLCDRAAFTEADRFGDSAENDSGVADAVGQQDDLSVAFFDGRRSL